MYRMHFKVVGWLSIDMAISHLRIEEYLPTISPLIRTQLEALARNAVVTICISWAIVDMTVVLRSCALLKHTHVPA